MDEVIAVFIFPIRVKNGSEVLKYVSPIKQKAVQAIIELAAADCRVERVFIFGSAVTNKCGMLSDIDMAIDSNVVNDEEFAKVTKPFNLVPSEVDIINYNNIHSDLLKSEIDNKGVCIYVKQ